MRRIAAVLTLAALAGCAAAPPRVVVPDVVTKEVDRYVPVPAELLVPFPIEQRQDDTAAEAVRVARVRGATIETCNSRLGAIGQIHGGQAQPP